MLLLNDDADLELRAKVNELVTGHFQTKKNRHIYFHLAIVMRMTIAQKTN